ncbi:MAG: ribosome maturation factor RimM [Rhodothermales bacterium]|nr:ribosome maturation factor RimM [Rhodothermales bacterium]
MSIRDPQSATPDPGALLLVGRAGKPHGVRGEVKVIPETDDPARFDALETVYLGATPEGAVPYAVESVRTQHTKRGLTVLLKLAGLAGKDDAAALRGLAVYAHEADLPPLGDDEFFLHDLVGLAVFTDDDAAVGTVRDVMELPSHAVLVVAREGKADALVPAVPAFIDDIDFDAGRLVVNAIEGLFE